MSKEHKATIAAGASPCREGAPACAARALLAAAALAALLLAALLPPSPASASETGGPSSDIYAVYYESDYRKVLDNSFTDYSEALMPWKASAYTLVIQGDDTDRSGEYGWLVEKYRVGPGTHEARDNSNDEFYLGSGSRGWDEEWLDRYVTRVVVADEVRPTDTYRWFADMENLSLVEGLENLDASDAADVAGMFSGCSSLKYIDLPNLDVSNATDVAGMFSGCSSLESLDLSGFDTSKVEDLSGVFAGCSSLEKLDVSHLDTSSACSTAMMFSGCSSLESLDLTGLDTSNVEDMDGMFSGCSSLESLDLLGFDTSKVEDMASMFSNCDLLKSLNLSGFDTSRVVSMWGMFSGCDLLKSLNLSSFDTSNVEDMGWMFQSCPSLESLDLSGFDAPKVTSVFWMFMGCDSLKTLALPNLDTSKIDRMEGLEKMGLYGEETISVGAMGDYSGLFPDTIYADDDDYEGTPAVWRNERGEAFSADDVPAHTAGTYTREPGVSIEDAKVRLSFTSATYTGGALRPKAIVTLGGKTLRPGVDYALTYEDNKLVGLGLVQAKGKGTHVGIAAATFKVNPEGTGAVKLAAKKTSLTVKWKKQSVQTDGYQVRWSTSKSMKNAKVKTVKGASKTSAKVGKLKSGKRYYVQVRTYKKVDDAYYYSAWSKAKSVRTKK